MTASEWMQSIVPYAMFFLAASAPSHICFHHSTGLLLSLEKLHSTLVLCQAALVQYVEGQRLKCSWFYLLPLEDILQLMCYGVCMCACVRACVCVCVCVHAHACMIVYMSFVETYPVSMHVCEKGS